MADNEKYAAAIKRIEELEATLESQDELLDTYRQRIRVIHALYSQERERRRERSGTLPGPGPSSTSSPSLPSTSKDSPRNSPRSPRLSAPPDLYKPVPSLRLPDRREGGEGADLLSPREAADDVLLTPRTIAATEGRGSARLSPRRWLDKQRKKLQREREGEGDQGEGNEEMLPPLSAVPLPAVPQPPREGGEDGEKEGEGEGAGEIEGEKRTRAGDAWKRTTMRSPNAPVTRLDKSAPLTSSADRTLDQLWLLPPTTLESEWIAYREDSQIPMLIGNISGYIREQGRSDSEYLKPGPGSFALIEPERYVHYYTKIFDKKEHDIYISTQEDGIKVGAAIIACEAKDKESGKRDLKAIVFTKKGTERLTITPDAFGPLRQIKARLPILSAIQFGKLPARRVTDARQKLIKYETLTIQRNYKFGVLYSKEGQTEENDMFNNETGSAEFNEFLEFLGDKIPLQGWQGYTGGLDVKHNCTGTHSIHTTYENCEVMFHVSTLLQYYPADPQQIERKRHLGNDVVMIVFRDSGKNPPFDPSIIKSQFNHVFLVVTPSNRVRGIGPDKEYKISIACKYGVVPFPPYLPAPNVIANSRKGRQWLISKLINAERAAFHASEFVLKLQEARKVQLKSIVEDFHDDASTSSLAALSSISKKTGTKISFSRGRRKDSQVVSQFPVKFTPKTGAAPINATLHLAPDKFVLLEPKTLAPIETWSMTQLKSWHFGETDELFYFDLGEHRPEHLVVSTNKQRTIDQMLSDYVEAIISSQEVRQQGRAALTTSAVMDKSQQQGASSPTISLSASAQHPTEDLVVQPIRSDSAPIVPPLALSPNSANAVLVQRGRSASTTDIEIAGINSPHSARGALETTTPKSSSSSPSLTPKDEKETGEEKKEKKASKKHDSLRRVKRSQTAESPRAALATGTTMKQQADTTTPKSPEKGEKKEKKEKKEKSRRKEREEKEAGEGTPTSSPATRRKKEGGSGKKKEGKKKLPPLPTTTTTDDAASTTK